MLTKITTTLLAIILLNGCTVISSNRVFPKVVPYWSDEAKWERDHYAH